MAFPIDARIRTYTQLQPVVSGDLNQIQDAIIGINGTRIIHYINGGPATANGWLLQTVAAVEQGWILSVSGDLVIPIPCRVGATLDSLRLKVFNTAGVAWSIDIGEIDGNWTLPATAPTWTPLASATPTYAVTSWNTEDLDSTDAPNLLPQTLAADRHFVLRMNAPTVGDMFAGVRCTFSNW